MREKPESVRRPGGCHAAGGNPARRNEARRGGPRATHIHAEAPQSGSQGAAAAAASSIFPAAFDQLPCGAFAATPDGKLLAANRPLAELLGFADAASLRGARLGELVGNEGAFPAWLRQVRTTGESTWISAQLRGAHGESVAAWLHARRVPAEGGCPEHLVGLVQPRPPGRPGLPSPGREADAPQRREPSLHASGEWSRGVIEAADRAGVGLAISVVADGGAGTLRFINAAGARILGQPAESLVGGPQFPLVPPALERRMRDRAGAPGGPESRTVVLGVARPDGAAASVEVGLAQGTYWGQPAVFAFFLDVTSREAAERERQHALSLLASTLESTTDGILVVDRRGGVATFNRRLVEMWRLPDDVMEGRDDEAALKAVQDDLEDPEAFVGKVRALYAEPEAESFDEIKFRDGRIFERFSRPQRIGGEVVGRVWSFRDVTERRRADRELADAAENRRTLEMLRETDRFKTTFLNTAAHELGTPLTPIKLQVHILRTDPGLSLLPEQRNCLDILDRNVERLAALVKDILESARVQAGRIGLRPEATDVSRIVREAIESFHEAARREGVALEARVPPSLPVQADPRRLSQVLYNLLGNALKFTPRGGRVIVEAAERSGCVEVRVADTGIGLRPGDIARLFTPFTQFQDASLKGRSGTGLGLYISRGIVQRHGGSIWAESPGPGKGSVFTFTIPLVPPADAGHDPPAEPGGPESAAAQGSGGA